MTAVMPDPRYPKASLAEPERGGFIYLGMRVDPPRRLPFVRRSASRDRVISAAQAAVQELRDHPRVVTARAYRAVLIPPVPGSPRFHVVALIRTTAPDAIAEVRGSAPYRRLRPTATMTDQRDADR